MVLSCSQENPSLCSGSDSAPLVVDVPISIEGYGTWSDWIESDPVRIATLHVNATDLLLQCFGNMPDAYTDSNDGTATFVSRMYAVRRNVTAGLGSWKHYDSYIQDFEQGRGATELLGVPSHVGVLAHSRLSYAIDDVSSFEEPAVTSVCRSNVLHIVFARSTEIYLLCAVDMHGFFYVTPWVLTITICF